MTLTSKYLYGDGKRPSKEIPLSKRPEFTVNIPVYCRNEYINLSSIAEILSD
jgi:hypothetical protein